VDEPYVSPQPSANITHTASTGGGADESVALLVSSVEETKREALDEVLVDDKAPSVEPAADECTGDEVRPTYCLSEDSADCLLVVPGPFMFSEAFFTSRTTDAKSTLDTSQAPYVSSGACILSSQPAVLSTMFSFCPSSPVFAGQPSFVSTRRPPAVISHLFACHGTRGIGTLTFAEGRDDIDILPALFPYVVPASRVASVESSFVTCSAGLGR